MLSKAPAPGTLSMALSGRLGSTAPPPTVPPVSR